MTAIHDDLLAVLDAVEILSPTCYALRGEQREIPNGDPSAASPATGPERLVAALAADLYERLYIRPSLPSLTRADVLATRDLIAALSAANTGRGTWESGWRVRGIEDDGQVVVAKEGVDFWIAATDLRARNGSIRLGETCQVRVAKELRDLVPGFYLAIGDGDGHTQEDGDRAEPLDRYYWHLRPGAAVPLVAAATSLLNQSRIPFRLKVLSDPRAFRRADAGVLYLHRRCRARVGAALAGIHSAVASVLGAAVPLFTKRLADGLGFAEDPAGSLSFGQHRCQLAAAGLWESFLRGEIDRDARAAALALVFAREGLDPLRPHLGPGSQDDGPFGPFPAGTSSVRSIPVGPGTGGPALGTSIVPAYRSLIEAAAAIGMALCKTAYWDPEGRVCNWMGRSTAELTDLDGPITPTLAALGPDLFAGSAGIALFLAQLHARTGNPEFRRTALGAIAHSIRQLGHLQTTGMISALSFFCGHLGVAYVARQVGSLTESPGCDAHAASILDEVASAISEPHVLDVIGGNAGAIPALLALSRSPGLERFLALAIELGDELGRSAIRKDNTCAWEPTAASGPGFGTTPQTGLSHGAAGIGLALFELSAATGRVDFRETARGAFAYEDALFDAQQGNWPDLRLPPRLPAFARAWCHGAPGIALARMHAATIDPERREDYLALARKAITTTLQAIEEKLAWPWCDATPCNGLAGLIEILFIAGEVLDDPSYRERALAAARALIDRHAESGEWPSGAPSGGPNPSLMLGTAGVGYTFLRLHDPETVPSVLLLTSWGGESLESHPPHSSREAESIRRLRCPSGRRPGYGPTESPG
jgi:hypothetical protein